MSKCFCHLNGYEVKDANARKSIESLNQAIENLNNLITDLSNEDVLIREDFQRIVNIKEELEAQIVNLQTSDSNFNLEITRIDTAITNITNELSSLATKDNSIDEEINNLKEKDSLIDAEIEALKVPYQKSGITLSISEQNINTTQSVITNSTKFKAGNKIEKDSTEPNKIKIGAGVNFVEASGIFSFSGATKGQTLIVKIYKNNEEVAVNGISNIDSWTNTPLTLPSVIIPVQEGDLIYFKANVGADNGSIRGSSYITIKEL